MTLLLKLNRLPPIQCLVLARHNRKPIPLSAIAKAVGLSTQKTACWLGRAQWDEVPVGLAIRLRAACGVTEATERAQARYLRRALLTLKTNPTARAFQHLDRLSPNQRARLRKLQKRALASGPGYGA